MPRHALNLLLRSTLCRRRVLESTCSNKIIRCYSNCVCRYKDYKISLLSDSYIKCTRNSLLYELTFSEVKLRRIRRKRHEKLEAARIAAS